MRRIITLILTATILWGVVAVFSVTVSAGPGNPSLTVAAGEVAEITEKKGYDTLTLYGTMIVRENAAVSASGIAVQPGGTLIIDAGATFTLNGGSLNDQSGGKIEINGKLGGSVGSLTLFGDISLGDHGVIAGLKITGGPSGYASSLPSQFANKGIEAIENSGAIYAFGKDHQHTYVDSVCSDCGLVGCVRGECAHTYKDNVCTACKAVNAAHTHTYQNYVCTVCGAIDPEHPHRYQDYVCALCGGIDPSHPHQYENSVCTICRRKCLHSYFEEYTHKCHECGAFQCDVQGHSFNGRKCSVCDADKCETQGHSYHNGKCTVCFQTCKNEFHSGNYKCTDCGMKLNAAATGSVLSNGNIAIVAVIVGVAAGLVIGIIIGKKKKPAVADGAEKENEDEDEK